MLRHSTLALLLVLVGCAAKQPEAKLCNMPVGLRGWGGVNMRLTGVVVGGFEHGFSISDEHCARGGELVFTSQTVNGNRLLERLHAIGTSTGVTRMDVSATIATSDGSVPKLRVTRYYGSSFEPMSKRQLIEFDRKQGM
jgi:hypothetical protein